MAKCPECSKPAEARFAPFCSTRCQQIDLGRWLKGDYVIPGSRTEPDGAPPPRPGADEDAE
jgi:endogenous inhibitor of DNA gyrase (YacG/DUF329 family)